MAEAAVGQDTGVSLGKGAWDCDANREIPPEKEVSFGHHFYMLHGKLGLIAASC